MEGMPIDLGNGLIMRPVRDLRDAQRYSALSASINGQLEDEMCTQLLQHHPCTTYDDYVLVEDTNADRLASTTCLIPWQMSLCGIPLRAAMLELVVTHPDYRRRGLVRAQIDHFHRRVCAQQFDVSIIQGIAYYYRQFGYAYALDHRPFDRLPGINIAPGKSTSYHARITTPADIPALTALYQCALQAQDIHVSRDDAYWRFLLAAPYYTVRVIEHDERNILEAYVILQPHPAERTEIVEAAASTHEVALALLHEMSLVSPDEVRVPGNQNSILIQAARNLGSQPLPAYQWLLRITNVAALLAKLSPVFDQRLIGSLFAAYTGDIRINLFSSASRMRFTEGHLQGVDDLGFVDASMGADGGDLCIPPDAFTRLLFGYRTLDELLDAWPDTIIKDTSRSLLNTLFPKLSSCIWMPY